MKEYRFIKDLTLDSAEDVEQYQFFLQTHHKKMTLRSWAVEPEHKALIQARNVMALPVCFKHTFAAMADLHMGYGMPIGGVAALVDSVSPNMVGKDIGCGMGFVLTDIAADDFTKEYVINWRRLVRKTIPMGEGTAHEVPQEWEGFSTFNNDELKLEEKKLRWIRRCLGTLGGGNHFIEVQRCEAIGDDDFSKKHDGKIGIMIHSGSRNLGAIVADHYHKIALSLCESWGVELPSNDLAYLSLRYKVGQDYIRDMNFALDYAKENRRLMLEKMKECLVQVWQNEVEFEKIINIHHNYAAMEHHMGHNVWVHRKGATLARKGTIGLIPGSQGTSSYIVEGKGNPLSFESCSHGAGRRMGRKDACRRLDAETEMKKMGDTVFDSWDATMMKVNGEKVEVPDLEEAPGAYKNIDAVMEAQEDLVDIKVRLHPLGVLKGKKRIRR